jgi:2-methylcitrate dehydratase PrpD
MIHPDAIGAKAVPDTRTAGADPVPADGFSRELIAGLAAWRFETLPPEVVHTVKLFIIDTLGVIGGAAHAPGIEALNRRLSAWEAQGRATGLLGRRRYSPPGAALANGSAAHALDFDDMYDQARVHAYCVTLPAVLAAAEEVGGVSGRDFLLALATGVELHARLGLACYDSLGKGWHPTMTLGVLAAAVAAGRVLGLDEARLLHALGIAYHQCGGTAQSMADGALSKRIGAGFAARSAVLAAFLAADGITGPTRPLEGVSGLFRLHERGQVHPARITDGLGTRWEIGNYAFKPYPCCRCNHTTIGLAFRLRGMGVRLEEVAEAEILLPRVNWQTVGQPYQPALDSVVHAQFNVAYTFARALHDGRVDLASYGRPQITDPDIAALTARTRAREDLQADPTAMEPARVHLRLNDGRELEVSGNTVKGGPEDPLAESEVLDKFRACMAHGLRAEPREVERLAETVLALEREPDAAVLARRFPDAGR